MAPTSSGSWPTLSGAPTTRRSRPCSGTWSGRAGSATTPSRHCAPSPGRPQRAPGQARTRAVRPARPPALLRRHAVGAARGAGRWSLLPALETDPTRRAHAVAETLLERHGVVTRGAVMSERVPGGFAAVYKVLSAFEDTGRCRRGYFVDGLGAAQFGTAGAVDRLRTFMRDLTAPRSRQPLALAATDPANPYGAALPGRRQESRAPARAQGRRTGRAGGRRARRSTSSAAARPCSPSPRTRRSWRTAAGARPRVSKGRSAGSPSRRPTAPDPGRRTPTSAAGDRERRLHRDPARPSPEGLSTVPEGDTVSRRRTSSTRASPDRY